MTAKQSQNQKQAQKEKQSQYQESQVESFYENFEDFDIQDEMLDDIGGTNLDAVQSVVDKFDTMRRAKD